jgi:hypothetical protein
MPVISTPMVKRRVPPAGFIEPCLPTRDSPPIGAGWVHEIKHEAIACLSARKAPPGTRLNVISRNSATGAATLSRVAEPVTAEGGIIADSGRP